MKRTATALFTALCVVTAFGVSQARADFVPWTYNWEPSTLSIKAGGAGTGGLSFTDEPLKHADGTSDIVVTNIRAFSSALRSAADTFTNAPISFTLTLKDEKSNLSGTFKFNGVFNGSISATSANVTFTPTAPLIETLKIGANTYTVNLGSYAPPGPPAASNAGSISAHVAVNEIVTGGGGGGGGTGQAPEPSTLLLSCLGLSGMGLAGWRKWRQRLAAA